MKRRDAENPESGILQLLNNFAEARGLSFVEEATQDKLLEELRAVIVAHQTTPTRMFGFRAQAMFAYVAACLDRCAVVSEEDSGMFFDGSGELRRPDFRLVLKSGSQLLVEVKHRRSKKGENTLTFTSDYLESLQRYAALVNAPLKIAVFWSGWNVWTLTDPSRMISAQSKTVLRLADALKWNEMGTLGDVMIGTTPPLTMRVISDVEKPRAVGKDGVARITIGKVALLAADHEITDETERSIAWFLMLYGKWNKLSRPAKLDGDLLEYFDISLTPEEPSEDQGFDIIGTLSEMASIKYLEATTSQSKVISLTPGIEPNVLAITIPENYEGQALKLWRFYQKAE